MFLKQWPLLFLILVLRSVNSQRFDVVSTTKQPSHDGPNQKDSSDSCPGLKEHNYRLLALELQNAQFQKSMEKQWQIDANKLQKFLDDMNTKFENQMSTLLKVEKQCKPDADKLNKSKNDVNTKFETQISTLSKVEKQCKLDADKLEKSQSDTNAKFENQISTILKAIQGLDTKLGNMEDTIVDKINTTIQKQIEKKLNLTTTHHPPERKPPKHCVDIMQEGHRSSGVYTITTPSGDTSEVYCDMETRGGGWLYVLRRVDGSQDFYLPWKSYREGFGNVSNEFWLGLELLHQLTNPKPAELLINLVDWDNKKVHASYKQFQIGSEEKGYILVVEGYDGDVPDGLSVLKNMKFSTYDKDTNNCAQHYKAGWWFSNCYSSGSKLTGTYLTNTSKIFKSEGIHWLPLHHGSLKEVKMMIRPGIN